MTSKLNYIRKSAKYIIGAAVLATGLSSAAFGLEKDNDGYYLIRNKAELKEFAEKVNSGEEPDAHGKLMNDIVYNGSGVIENGDIRKDGLFERFTPIGTKDHKFSGELTSNGNEMKKIIGIYINEENDNFKGLCEILTCEGKINNIEITDSYIKGRGYVGGIAGANDGGEIENVKVTNSRIEGIKDYIGGITGINGNKITNCITDNITVKGRDEVGGIVGSHQGMEGIGQDGQIIPGILKNCESSGIVKGKNEVGGNIGENIGNIEGYIKNNATVEGFYNVGGNIGEMNSYVNKNDEDENDENENNINENLPFTLINEGNTKGEKNVGGNIGYNNAAGVIELWLKNKGKVTGNDYVGGTIGHSRASIKGGFLNLGEVTGTNYVGRDEFGIGRVGLVND